MVTIGEAGLRVILIIVTLLVCVPSVYAARMWLRVEGLHGELYENVAARLKVIETKTLTDSPQARNQVIDEIRTGLRALGYYDPRIQLSIKNGRIHTVLTAKVTPGKPVLIERVNIKIDGSGCKDPFFAHLLRDDTPKVGDVLNHGIYSTFKKRLQSIALSRGYFDSELKRSQLSVADKLHQAFWDIDFQTGDRYRLGKVTFGKTAIREDYLRRIIPFKEGDEYSSEAISLFSSRLSSSNWFNGITVLPDIHRAGKDRLIPLYVTAIPKKKNIFDVGLGYSTDIGTHGKLGWTKPWINSRGHSIYSNFSMSKVEQSVTGSYKIPLAKSPLEQYYTIQTGYKHENNNDTYSNSYSLGVIRNWDSFDNWQKAIGMNISYNRFTQADDRYTTFLIYPSFNLYRVRQRGGLLPMWGDSQRYAVEVAVRNAGSDLTFSRFTMQQAWIRSLWNEHRFIVRGNFGFIETGNFDRVPPSFRYFAGGDRSIRGYNYQSISPRDKKGKLLGAARLLTGSLEYQYRLTEKWWGAVFVDSGEAVNSFKHHNFYTGAGVGIRWVSPIGPIRVDVARPVDNKGKKSVHFYLGIGAEL